MTIESIRGHAVLGTMIVSLMGWGCGQGERDNKFGSGTLGPGTATGGQTTGMTGASGADAGEDAGEDAGDDAGDEAGTKFDTIAADGLPGGASDGGNGEGCDKVDFLFVIDNSGSMDDEQQNLVNAFPDFIDEIQNTLMAQDYHILVTDTDAGGGGGCFQSICCNVDCNNWCAQCMQQGCNCECNGMACPAPPQSDCDTILGAGKTKTPAGNDCGVQGGNRYMVDGQPDLGGTFACVGLVGTSGDGNERPMQSVMDSISVLNPQGECNEGFLRDDAILVATVITDEEDNGKSTGNPNDWYQALVDAKNGDEKAVVPLALVGDTDLPNPVCMPYDNGGDGAEGAPRIRQWAESFTYGIWGPVCLDAYGQFFHEAVSAIDTACTDFDPPG